MASEAQVPGPRTAFDLMDYTTDLVIVVDGSGRVRAASASVARTLAQAPGELYGRRWDELVHPDDRAMLADAVRTPAPDVAGGRHRFRLRDGAGVWRWLELASVLALHDPTDAGWVVIGRETGRALEVDRLAALRERLVRLANETTDLEHVLDSAAADIAASMGWASGTAFVVHDGTALPTAAALAGEAEVLDDPAVQGLLADVQRTSAPAWVVEPPDAVRPARMLVAVPVPDGRQMAGALVLVPAAPEGLSDAFVHAMTAVGWQLGMVASRQAARQTLERRDLELQRSNAELERFAYVASHDLQEPLRKVVTACELLERKTGAQLAEAGGQLYVDIAVDGARRMQALIRDLLAYSRIGRGGEPDATVDLGAVAAEVCADLSLQIEATGATVEIGELPEVRSSSHEMHQLLANLVSNALKFHADAPPHITIAAHAHPDGAEITVTDRGIGIDPQYADRVFDVFRRLHRADEYSGTGIGLAIAKRIAEHHGGRIWVTPVVDGGSCFHFTLPIGT